MVVGIMVDANHSDVGRYRRPASLTVGQEKPLFGLRVIRAEFGIGEVDFLGCMAALDAEHFLQELGLQQEKTD
ncbi:hypothetical protein L195_g018452 [Trifolium pratense]|uniref:Uncharacterized protein n=1 Tax=Trifolium pratense TaxID=57577 RepID=A0A2K3MWV3_TRIPR|nr:hypothetical protein L195_g018452 [Trifolium pratense]